MSLQTVSKISKVIAVTSCKGGVGKSTISFELASCLQKRGHRVGLFDADVFGPSLPTQIPKEVSAKGVSPSSNGWSMLPLIHNGMSLMSFGWLGRLWNAQNSQSHPSEFDTKEVDPRGAGEPEALAIQLLHTTEWGELDYLIIDTPPGTGSIPRALAARSHLAGAVVVTTPSSLAVADVVRGTSMLANFGIPILAVVENMASFRCHSCGTDHFPFGEGHLESVISNIQKHGQCLEDNVPAFRLPIIPNLEHSNDSASRSTCSPDSSLERELNLLAESIELDNNGLSPVEYPKLDWHEKPHWHDKIFFAGRERLAERRLSKDIAFKISKPKF